MDDKGLLVAAVAAMNRSYSPYSNFKVGAALLCKSGKVYTGCNIENAAYSETICAERTALFEAVKSGERDFECICIIGGKRGVISDFCYPCGSCRQVLSEFCDDSFKILLFDGSDFKTVTLGEILPFSFGGANL